MSRRFESLGTSYFDCEHLYCLHGAGLTGGSSCGSIAAILREKPFYVHRKLYIMQYSKLSESGKERARHASKLRYARRRDERRREVYLKCLPYIKQPRPATLEQYGLLRTPEGWADEFGTWVSEKMICECT